MKKLMIAVAIVCVAAASQAASFVWDPELDYSWNFELSSEAYAGYKGTTIGGNYTGSYASGATAYLMFADLESGDLLGYLRDGKTMSSTEISQYVLGSETIGEDGLFDTKTLTISGKKMYKEDTDVFMDAYLAIVDGDNVYLSDTEQLLMDQLTSTGDAAMDGSFTKKLRDNDGTHSYGNAGWYSTVPEPTSGLLLLLGVAGLALRRRRA